MITLILFLVGLLSLFTLDPDTTAFIYAQPFGLEWIFRFFAHQVSHGNFQHLFGNFMFGLPYMWYAEHKLKCWKKYLGLYFACGTTALVIQTLLMQFSEFAGSGCIGSSGAIFGIVAYALAAADHNKYIRIGAHCVLAYHLYIQGMMALMSLSFPFGIGFGAHFGGILCGISYVWVPRIRRLIKRLISR